MVSEPPKTINYFIGVFRAAQNAINLAWLGMLCGIDFATCNKLYKPPPKKSNWCFNPTEKKKAFNCCSVVVSNHFKCILYDKLGVCSFERIQQPNDLHQCHQLLVTNHYYLFSSLLLLIHHHYHYTTFVPIPVSAQSVPAPWPSCMICIILSFLRWLPLQ